MGTVTVKWPDGKKFVGIELSKEKYCSVAATVRATAQITTDLEILVAVTA